MSVMVVQQYGRVCDRPRLKLHGRHPIEEVRKIRIGALVGASRSGKSTTKEVIEQLHPGKVVWIPKRCLPRKNFRPDEGQGHVLPMEPKDLFAQQDRPQLVTSIVDLRVPEEIRTHLSQRYGFRPPRLHEHGRMLFHYVAVFYVEELESILLNLTEDQIVLVELSVWDIEGWKAEFPNTEVFWLEAPPEVIVERSRISSPTGLRTVYSRARLTEALLSLLSPPIEIYQQNPTRLWSVNQEDRRNNAKYIWDTLQQ